MPYAVLGAMTFPAIFHCTNSVISASLGFFAAMIMAYMNMGLMPAAVAAVAVVFITELFMH